jgi:hypothetical protein
MKEDDDIYHSTFVGSRDILDKCCLEQEEMDEYLKRTEHIDPKDEHDHLYSVMTNETRRELLKFIDIHARSFEKIKDKFELEDEHLQYHLSMLEQLFFLMNTKNGWKATPRGLGFLYYTILK